MQVRWFLTVVMLIDIMFWRDANDLKSRNSTQALRLIRNLRTPRGLLHACHTLIA